MNGIVVTVTKTGGTVAQPPGGSRAGAPSMAMTGAPRILEWMICMYQVIDKHLFRQMFMISVEQGKSDLARAPSKHEDGGTAAPASIRARLVDFRYNELYELCNKSHELPFNIALQSHWRIHQRMAWVLGFVGYSKG